MAEKRFGLFQPCKPLIPHLKFSSNLQKSSTEKPLTNKPFIIDKD